jgi:DNA-binding IscR family transcriptional regulator
VLISSSGSSSTHVPQREAAESASGRLAGRSAPSACCCGCRAEPAPLADLENDPETPSPETIPILEDLTRAGLVSGDAAGGFRLAAPGREITVARIVEALSPGLYQIDPNNQDRVALVLEPLFYRLDAERRALLNAPLADLRRT